jgi:hypothetical protein
LELWHWRQLLLLRQLVISRAAREIVVSFDNNFIIF